MAEDLWGELPSPDTKNPPVRLLKEQAAILGQKTGNLIEGRVDRVLSSGKFERWTFALVVPVLGGYSFSVADLDSPILDLYPAELTDRVNSMKHVCSSEEELKERLRELFRSDKMRFVISSLLRNVNVAMQGA